MNELQKKEEQVIISSAKEMAKLIELEHVHSLSYKGGTLKLLDYEEHFKKNYFVRFNEVSTKYENGLVIYEEGYGEKVDWKELSEDELTSDLIRAGAKGKGTLTEKEVARMLGDRRLVPSHDPFYDYFLSISNLLPQDDTFDYIDDFANYLTVDGGEKEQNRWRSNFKKALVRTVKCALSDRYFNKHAIVLYSADQSVGKTSYLRTLSPPALKKYYYEGGIGTDKDSQTVLAKNFIIMIDELANLSRVDINVLKATLSRLNVNIRLPYAKNFQEFPRRASFFGTTNRTDFLTDSENVRWLVFNVETINKDYGNIFTGEFKIDINKIWAQAYRLYRQGFNCELSADDLSINEENNIMYSATSLEKEVITNYLEPAQASDKDRSGYYRGQASDIFDQVCKLLEADGRLHTLKSIKPNIFFIELSRMSGWRKKSIRVGGKNVSGYHYFVTKEKDNSELPF